MIIVITSLFKARIANFLLIILKDYFHESQGERKKVKDKVSILGQKNTLFVKCIIFNNESERESSFRLFQEGFPGHPASTVE